EPRGSERVNTRSGLARASNATTTSGGSRVVACEAVRRTRPSGIRLAERPPDRQRMRCLKGEMSGSE
ncbi:MAG: hypothetical protein WAN16_05950, partial [Chthoniobacterales bacterium]